MNAAIATKLNVLESAIIRIEEWANVMFVVVRGLGGRFVSKKVVVQMTEKKITTQSAIAAGGSYWAKGDRERVYFELESLVEMTNSQKRKHAGTKIYFDCTDGKIYSDRLGSDYVKAAIREIRERATVESSAIVTETKKQCCFNCGVSGLKLLGGSLGLLCPDCYDEIEGDL